MDYIVIHLAHPLLSGKIRTGQEYTAAIMTLIWGQKSIGTRRHTPIYKVTQKNNNVTHNGNYGQNLEHLVCEKSIRAKYCTTNDVLELHTTNNC